MPNFLDALGNLIRGSDQKDPLQERYGRLLEEMGSPRGAMLQSDINRGVLPGQKSPWAEGLPPEELAQLDRYAWGRAGGIASLPAGIPATLYSEAVKFPWLADALKPVTEGLAKVSGQDPSIFEVDETSSPPSLRNVGAFVRGALGR